MATPNSDRPLEPDAWGQAPRPGPVRPLPSGTAPPSIAKGSLIIIRQFDVADEIDLERARGLQLSERIVLAKPRATALLLSNPPLAVSLGRRTIELGGKPVEVDVYGRIFDFGAISIRFRLPLARDIGWADLSALTFAAQTAESPTRVAREATAEIIRRLVPAKTGAAADRSESALFEDYVIVQVEEFAGSVRLADLPLDAIAELLLGEGQPLSKGEVDETTRHRSSYYDNDLCVMGWNVALVVEPKGDLDPIDVLELANAQLLELRYYDSILDRELARLYDEVGRGGRRPMLLRNYAPVLRRVMMLMLEIAEFVERAENALKIIGDVYLARLYGSAVGALRIGSWERAVTRKQALVQQVYDVLKSEVDARRGQVMEIIVIALIVGEILIAMHV